MLRNQEVPLYNPWVSCGLVDFLRKPSSVSVPNRPFSIRVPLCVPVTVSTLVSNAKEYTEGCRKSGRTGGVMRTPDKGDDPGLVGVNYSMTSPVTQNSFSNPCGLRCRLGLDDFLLEPPFSLPRDKKVHRVY